MSSLEQLPARIRFVDKHINICEDILEFGSCKQVIGEAIAEEIICILGGIYIKYYRGQSSDGTSKIWSCWCARLNQVTAYTRCLNLSFVIVTGCKILIIRNTLDIVKNKGLK